MSKIKIQNIPEYISTLFLILVAVIGLGVGIVDIFNIRIGDKDIDVSNLISPLTLTLLGTLGVGLGLEKSMTYKKIESGYRDLESKIESSLTGGVYLDSWEEIYGAAKLLVTLSKRTIKATAFGEREQKSPHSFLDTLVQIVKEKNRKKEDFRYTLVFDNYEKMSKELVGQIKTRLDKFEQEEIRENFEIKCLKEKSQTFGFDVLISDNSAIIAFTGLGTSALAKGIMYVNQEKLVKDLKDWYDEYIDGEENSERIEDAKLQEKINT